MDRGFTADLHLTKMKFQPDYEKFYIGTPLSFNVRTGNLIAMVWVCISLSSGMPLFYVLGLFTALYMYYADKYLSKYSDF
jgi:hypothetical protein